MSPGGWALLACAIVVVGQFGNLYHKHTSMVVYYIEGCRVSMLTGHKPLRDPLVYPETLRDSIVLDLIGRCP